MNQDEEREMAQTAETRDAKQRAADIEQPAPDRRRRTRGRRPAQTAPPRATRTPTRSRAARSPAIRSNAPSALAKPEATGAAQEADHRQDVAREASGAILGANPFVGVDPGQMAGATGRWLGSLSERPSRVTRRALEGVLELGRIGLGRSKIAPERGDRRFTDPAWAEHPGFHRAMQSYLLFSSTLRRLVEDADLDQKNAQRARYSLELITDALAPTNNFLSNPAAIKRAFDTAGVSVLRGARNFVRDLKNNGGMPSMVDKRPFEVGSNLAVTPGAVVYRDDVIELLQYAPTTETVYQKPIVLIPPQINKYYVLDLASGRSFIEYAVSQGVPFFAISWRNPMAEHRDWGLETYVQACLSAVDAASEIAGSDDCNVLGACAGGITMALMLGYLAVTNPARIGSATFAVTIIDTQAPSLLGMFASPATVAAAVRRSRRKGYLDGAEMARVFAWLRPNDLVWNYWVNNYLLGNDPPPFDILFWNADNTRLPARLHAEFLELFEANSLLEPGAISVLDTPVDLRNVKVPSYVLAGVTDHIVPWRSAYGATQALGGPIQFVLSSSGHIQSLVNPPGNPKASYHVDGPQVPDPEGWLRGANEVRGTWWEHWARWIGEQSGDRVPAPGRLGSDRHRPMEGAPGRYVHEK